MTKQEALNLTKEEIKKILTQWIDKDLLIPTVRYKNEKSPYRALKKQLLKEELFRTPFRNTIAHPAILDDFKMLIEQKRVYTAIGYQKEFNLNYFDRLKAFGEGKILRLDVEDKILLIIT